MAQMTLLSLVFLLSYCNVSMATDFDKKECILSDRWPVTNAIPPTESCPDDVLSGFPDSDSFAMILEQESLHDQSRVRRFKRKEGKPASNTCYQRDEAVQFVVGTYDMKETLVIYFYGTENDFDMETDLEVEHSIAYLPDILTSEIKTAAKDDKDLALKSKFRVHKGVYENIISRHFTNILREKLLGIYFEYLDDSKNAKPTKLVIGGRSLGAAYAIMFYLELIGGLRWTKYTGFHFLPTELEAITVIPICSPMIVHHKDVGKISEAVQSRIYNIITYRDPVVIMLSGHKSTYKKELDNNLWTILEHITDYSLEKLGTNGPVGKFIMLMRSNIKKKKYKNKIVVKVLDRDEVYLNEGAKCLWENTKGGILAMKKLWPEYHRKQPYLDHIMHSCINKYLRTSNYWNTRKLIQRISKKKRDKKKKKRKIIIDDEKIN